MGNRSANEIVHDLESCGLDAEQKKVVRKYLGRLALYALTIQRQAAIASKLAADTPAAQDVRAIEQIAADLGVYTCSCATALLPSNSSMPQEHSASDVALH